MLKLYSLIFIVYACIFVNTSLAVPRCPGPDSVSSTSVVHPPHAYKIATVQKNYGWGFLRIRIADTYTVYKYADHNNINTLICQHENVVADFWADSPVYRPYIKIGSDTIYCGCAAYNGATRSGFFYCSRSICKCIPRDNGVKCEKQKYFRD